MRPAFLDALSWEIAEVYGAISDQILVNLARHFPYYKPGDPVPRSAFVYQADMLAQMGQVNAETMRIIRNGLGDADEALKSSLETSIIRALRTANPELLKGVKAGIFQMPSTPVVAPNQMRAFQLYYEQAANKLNLVNTVMLESTQQAYQSAITDIVSEMALGENIGRVQTALDVAAGETITGVSSWNTAVRHATQRMTEAGITGFVDHGGHRWSAEAYAAMDIRTTMANTARAAVWEQNERFGNDLYIVSYHNGARPLCYPWQNKVISSADRSGVTYDLDGNEITIYPQSSTSYGEPAGLFGINCGHMANPFIPGVSIIRGEPQSPEENEKTYQESQEQRRLERKLREQKRDVMMAKAQGAPQEEIDALTAKQRATSQEIDDFCEQTGRTRRRNREGVYTKREFPEADSYDPSTFVRDQKDEVDKFYRSGGAQQGYTFGQMTPNVPITPANVAQQVTTPSAPVVQSQVATSKVVTEELPKSGIKTLDVKKLETPLSEQEIIFKLGGGDETKGSCSSLAYAYAGQKSGYDVIDFRGGKSQDFFSSKWLDITAFDGVDGKIVKEYNDFVGAHSLLSQVETGREYYFSTGRHAAIVRKAESGLQYLELQSVSDNGWKTLDDKALRWRFGARKSHTTHGMKYRCASTLVDIEKFGESPDFVEMLKYINTEVGKQKKGVLGSVR